jgi:hypothetical protein
MMGRLGFCKTIPFGWNTKQIQRKLKRRKLGEIGPPDEEAWEGEEDPFNNLAGGLIGKRCSRVWKLVTIEAIGKSHQIAAKKIAPKKAEPLQRQREFQETDFLVIICLWLDRKCRNR